MPNIDTDALVGMSKADALAEAEHGGFKVRVRREDGNAFIGTCDYRRDRVNLEVEGGKVIRAWVG